MLARLKARQLAHPSGVIGRWMLAPLWNRRNVALNDAALARLELRPDDRVLEVGFGGGYLLGRMARSVAAGSIAGVDLSETMVAACRQRYRSLVQVGRLDLRCAPAEALPFPPAQFDKACTVNSIFYWTDAQIALAEIARMLKEDGLLVMCFTGRASLERKDFAPQGLTLYEADDVHPMLADAGFTDITAERLADRHREFWCMTARKARPVAPEATLR